jgi:hypothetical protein
MWVVAAAAATAVGLFAVAAIGTDIFGAGQDPLSEAEVDRLLASRSATPTTTRPTQPTAPSPTAPSSPAQGERKETVTDGGVVIARCAPSGLVEVLSATPAQGYAVDGEDDDLDDHPSVTFTSGDREIEVRFRCRDGIPVPEIRYDD